MVIQHRESLCSLEVVRIQDAYIAWNALCMSILLNRMYDLGVIPEAKSDEDG